MSSSKAKRRIILHGFGRSLWSAIGCQRKSVQEHLSNRLGTEYRFVLY